MLKLEEGEPYLMLAEMELVGVNGVSDSKWLWYVQIEASPTFRLRVFRR
jgi:hypothetical protein